MTSRCAAPQLRRKSVISRFGMHFAQGAVQAIEDGHVLARALDAPGDAPRRYETVRRERTARRALAPIEIARRFHDPELADPQGGAPTSNASGRRIGAGTDATGSSATRWIRWRLGTRAGGRE